MKVRNGFLYVFAAVQLLDWDAALHDRLNRRDRGRRALRGTRLCMIGSTGETEAGALLEGEG